MQKILETVTRGYHNSLSLFALINNLRFNATHYNSITDAWRHIFGDNFHFGYFSLPEISLDEATDALIHEMASIGNISSESNVLDVGCGIGNPAFYLHKKYGCSITGISTSEKGIVQAQQLSQQYGYSEKVRFLLADGLDNGFPADSFDVTWVMESSHLMEDRTRLFKECYRVLKPGGHLLLCDLILKKPYTALDRMRILSQLGMEYLLGSISIIKAFGNVKMKTIEFYREGMLASGFTQVHTLDISREAKATFGKWKDNIITNRDNILETLTETDIDHFIKASDLGEYLFDQRVTGYAIFKATKP